MTALIVPFGQTAYRGWWEVRFSAGALSISDVERVPFMFEHGATLEVAGVMTDATEERDGIHATFAVDDTTAGDRAWAELQAGSRTGFSIGIAYDDDTLEAIWDALDEYFATGERPVVDASGAILETSHVAIPAFDDARSLELSEDPDRAEPVGAN